MLLTGVAAAVLVVVPWLDRPARRGQPHWMASVLGWLGVAYVVGMTAYARFAGRHG